MSGVPFAVLDRAKLERVTLEQQALLRDLLEIVRNGTKPDWGVRKRFEERIERYQGVLDRQLGREVIGQVEQERLRRQVHQQDSRWTEWDARGERDLPDVRVSNVRTLP